jgi:hypothetical protein
MNTTALITYWTMDGASNDIDRRFGSPVDILALVHGSSTELGVEASSVDVVPSQPNHPPLLVKKAGQDEWESLGEVA